MMMMMMMIIIPTSWKLFYKHGRRFEVGTTENKSSRGRDLNSGLLD